MAANSVSTVLDYYKPPHEQDVDPYTTEKTVSRLTANHLTLVPFMRHVLLHQQAESLHWREIVAFGGPKLAYHLLQYPHSLRKLAEKNDLGDNWCIGFVNGLIFRGESLMRETSPLFGVMAGSAYRRYSLLPTEEGVAIYKKRGIKMQIASFESIRSKVTHICALKKQPPP